MATKTQRVTKIDNLTEVKPLLADDTIIVYTQPGCSECENIKDYLNKSKDCNQMKFIEVDLNQAKKSNLNELVHTNSFIATPVVEHYQDNTIVKRVATLEKLKQYFEEMK